MFYIFFSIHLNTQKSVVPQLERISFIMDRLLEIPGTKMRFGLNSIFMFLPLLGSALPTAVSIGIVIFALCNYRVPRIVALRMVLNSALDASVSWIPIVGDAFDLFFKADTRNVRLLQQYMGSESTKNRFAWGDWFFVIGLLGLLFVLIGLALYGMIMLVRSIFHSF